MNETLERILTNAKTLWSGLSLQKKLGLIFATLSTCALAAVGVMVYRYDPMQPTFTDLQLEDSKGVEKKLSEASIPYSVSEEHATISVPKSLISAARMQVAKDGIPGQDVVGFEKFDASMLGMSSYVQRIQYVRAVQGELIRTIERLASVKRARVHISVPPRKTFLDEEDPPKASVVLELKQGQQPSKSEVRGIASLVSSAVEGLKVSQVTIVDTKGNLLHKPEDEATPGVSTALLEYERSIEGEYEKRIEDMLTPVVGLGKVRAKVTAEIDPARINTTEESYDADKAAVKNKISNDEVNAGQRPNPIGIPGSRSNLPGAEAQNPPIPVASSSSEKNMQNTSYAIPRRVQITDKPSGSIKRLTVAVVVDGVYAKVSGGKTETYSPRSDDDLKRFRDLVANAVGFDDSRRDSITVSSLPFHLNDFVPAEEPPAGPWYKSPDVVRPLLRNLGLGLAGLLFFFLVIRPLFRWALRPEKQPEISQFPRTVAEIEAANKEEGLLSLTKSAGVLEESQPLEKREEEELKKRILDRLEQAPKKGFRIVQDWLEEENGAPAEAAA